MTNVSVQADTTEKEMIEAVSYDMLNCSQSAGLKHAAEQFYSKIAGDIHPRAIRDGAVDVEALMAGDLDPEDVDEKYRMDGDGPAQIPTADGGVSATPTPSSYTPTYTPQDLATSGAELTWDELTDALGNHWSNTLEIHEDRVRSSGDVVMDGDDYSDDPYAVKANQTVVAKILAGILRMKGDSVPKKLVEAKILQYTEHQITRADKAAGRRYKKETYTDLLVDELGYLIPHPDPLKDEYYTSEAAAKELFAEEVSETIADLVEKTWVLNPKDHVQQTGIAVKEDAEQWVRDLAEFRQNLGFLQAVTSDETWSEWLEDMDDPVGDMFNAKVAAAKTYNELLQQYVRVNQWARFAAAHAVLEVESDDVLTDEVSTGDDWKQINADNPTQPLTKWVTHRDTPLSPQAQIDTVSEKL